MGLILWIIWIVIIFAVLTFMDVGSLFVYLQAFTF